MIAKIIALSLAMTLGLCTTAQAQTSIRIHEIHKIFNNPRDFLLANPEIMKQQVGFLLRSRCLSYVGDIQCANAAKQLIEDLHIEPLEIEDPTTGKKLPYIVTFTDELRDIYKDPRLPSFLLDLENQLIELQGSIDSYQFIAPKLIKPFDMGYFTVRHFGSFETSLKVLATLFQDIPVSIVQIHYLHNTYGDTPMVRQLYSVLKRIADMQNIRVQFPLKVFDKTFYGTTIYHTLVPAYLANKLHARGYAAQTAFFTAFVFNYIYEAGEAGGSFKTYMMEPGSLARTDTQNDIRAGELGALLGIGHSNKFLSEEKARMLLKKSPAIFLSTLGKLLSISPYSGTKVHRDKRLDK